MRCDLCKGSGNLLAGTDFWTCPKCGGSGVSVSGLVGPEIRLSKNANRFMRPSVTIMEDIFLKEKVK